MRIVSVLISIHIALTFAETNCTEQTNTEITNKLNELKKSGNAKECSKTIGIESFLEVDFENGKIPYATIHGACLKDSSCRKALADITSFLNDYDCVFGKLHVKKTATKIAKGCNMGTVASTAASTSMGFIFIIITVVSFII